ncbi:MAG: sulfite exporter TauE/SafE family protein [Oligoflexia bacterium]|nr:sulfite exporter TauE/SafE family protein [Oligoflexia bacterium]
MFLYGIVISAVSISMGVGGGLITVPFLHIVINLPMNHAMAISLSSVAVISFIGSIVFRKRRYCDFLIIKKTILYCILGAIIGAWTSSYLPVSILKYILGILLLFIASKYLFAYLNKIIFRNKYGIINN